MVHRVRSASELPWSSLNYWLRNVNPVDHRHVLDAIAKVYDVIAQIPPQILQDYAAFTEESLTRDLGDRGRRILAGDIEVSEADIVIETVCDAARLLRALEMVALEGRQYLATDRDDELEREFVTTDLENFVIPRISALSAIDGKPFLRRALLNHRVIPTRIGSFRIRLHRSRLMLGQASALARKGSTKRNYGAAFFPGLKVGLTPPNIGDFTVTSLSGFNAEDLIDDHLARALADGCGTIIWSELTMPGTSVDQVRQRLRDKALDDEPDFQYLVAGSWHRNVDGMRNAASIIGGDGELLFDVLKWAKFEFSGRREAIVPGEEVHVLICEDELVTIAVCKDFLDETTDVPYRNLNVDVAIVPSMVSSLSEAQTMKGHAATANVMRNRFGTRTLVVAQPARPGRGKAVGQVLQLPAKPLLADPVSVTGPWHLCAIDGR